MATSDGLSVRGVNTRKTQQLPLDESLAMLRTSRDWRHKDSFVYPVAFSASAQRLIYFHDVYRYHPADATPWQREVRLSIDPLQVCCATLAPNGQSAVTGLKDGSVIVWDLQTGKRTRTLSGHARDTWVFQVTFSRDGTMLASAGEDGQVILWDPLSGNQQQVFTTHDANACVCVAFSPDDRQLAMSDHDQVRRWDLETGEELGALRHPGWVRHFAYSPDGSQMAVPLAGAAASTWLWNLSASAVVRKYPSCGHFASFSDDGQQLMVGGGCDRFVRFFDLQKRQPRHLQPEATLQGHSDRVYSVVFAPRSGRVVSVGRDGKVILWGSGVSPIASQLATLDQPVNDMTFAAAGRLLVTADDECVRL